MSEKLQQSNERASSSEHVKSPEHHERIKLLETQGEYEARDQKEQLENVREEVDKLARHQKEVHLPKSEQKQAIFSPNTRSKQKKLAFEQVMKQTRTQLPPASRRFSQIIHQPVVEKTSDVMAKTVFRPSLTLGASAGALIGGSLFYGFARYYGFSLSGFEFIFSGLIGAGVGLIWEFAGYLAKKALGKGTSTS